ncbi:zinc ion binding transcription regulator [Forsythia ovata]|uniref:Zinc ion binding transcription regulator n=1 Tax=Forsythia ovata TaxID=205694 RepID=A0ABD1QCC9_9LAMI
MDSSCPCKSCRKKTLVQDDVTGNMVCASCGVVQDFDNFQAHIGGITGPAGTYVRVGTSGSGSVYNYKDTKIYQAQKLIEDLMFKLGLLGSKSDEVKVMIETITTGEYGQGKWFPVFVGACAYVAMRKDKKMLPIVEVSGIVGCDIYELGQMINRVVDFLDLKLPEFDIVNSLERAIRSYPRFVEVSEDVVQRMLKQGVFLVQCLIKWFLTTGRKPMPVVAAVLVFVAELNQLDVKIEDMAKELHVAVITCRRRYKELLERLVKVARALPWGEDVTMKNIVKNAPSVIQYMEMKSMTQCPQKRESFEHIGFDFEEVLGACLSKEIGYGLDSYTTEKHYLQYFEVDHPSHLNIEYPDKFQISPECLTMVYSNFLDEVSLVKATSECNKGNKRKKISFDLRQCTDWWKGKSDLSKKLLLKQIFEKDVGLDASPPSFDRGCLAYERRREKIKAAQLRIQKIIHPCIADSGREDYLCVTKHIKSGKKRRKIEVDIDWEDLIIETLLLHNVKEEEIEKGHYNVLLDLHVFDYGNV